MNIVTVANRLPVRMGEDGWELSPGGLVTALRPVMAAHSGAWVGWDGGTRGIPATMPDLSVRLLPIGLSASQLRQYYHGFANATLWPLLHDAIERSRFERAWWHGYQGVNAIFADKAVTALRDQRDTLAWVHDYHLMLVPRLIRERCPDQPVGFFLHVPWPPPDIFARLPWREDVLFGLLGADVVSFHTEGYRRNFVRTCGRLLAGTGVQMHGPQIILPDRRVVTTTSAPISIDAAEFARLATDPATSRDVEEIRDQFEGRALLLGVDRLDYTKGIIERLLAVEMLLERRADLRRSLAFLQVAVPSRDDVPEYRNLRATVERHIGRINGRFTEPGSDVPIHYLYRGAAATAARGLLRGRRRPAGDPAHRRDEPGRQGVRHGAVRPPWQRRTGAVGVHRGRRGAARGDPVQPVRRRGAVLPHRARAGAPAEHPPCRAGHHGAPDSRPRRPLLGGQAARRHRRPRCRPGAAS